MKDRNFENPLLDFTCLNFIIWAINPMFGDITIKTSKTTKKTEIVLFKNSLDINNLIYFL
jgi:hypothetical protein